MQYDFDQIIDRRNSCCFKYDALKMLYGREDLVSLWVADMDFAVAPGIKEALQTRLDHGVFGYNFRLDDYYHTIISWIQRRYGWQAEQDWIINTPGVVPALNLAVLTLTRPDDKILIQPPVYRPFFNVITDHKRSLITNPLKLENGVYQLDREDFERKIRQASLFILCNPHNPVGRVWQREELEFMAELCKRYDVPIMSDEIHCDLVYPEHEFCSMGSLKEYQDLVIVSFSPAKSFNLAGLGASVTVIPNPRLRKAVNDLNQYMHLFTGNAFGIEALKTAYNIGDDWLDALISYLDGNRQYLAEYIAAELPELSMIYPEGTFLAWINFAKLGMDDNALFDFLTNKARVALDPGRKYGVDGSGFSRLNFACPRSILEEAMDRLHKAIKENFR